MAVTELTTYSPCRVIVEYLDGEVREFGPVGGFVYAPQLTGDGSSAAMLEMLMKASPGAPIEHVASVPLVNIRNYRIEAW